MGELVGDYNHNHIETAAIGDFILASINKGNCFDKDITVKNKDVLEVHIVHNKATYLYYYKFLKGRWIEAEHFNAFDINNDYRAVSRGITKPEISVALKQIL